MKNKLKILFEQKQNDLLSIFFTAGYPNLNDTGKILKELEKNGVDLVEIGIPYSDPLADGPVIQGSSEIAIGNGMNLSVLFKQLKNTRTNLPIVLMGYLNTILQFGIEEFYKECSLTGISGIILPDLPLDEFEKEHKIFSEKYNINLIFLITPRTSAERIKKIDSLSTGFIYVVSSNSITGNSHSNFEDLRTFYSRLQLKNKTLIGFGISDHRSFSNACELANGAIIGSAFIRALSRKIPISEFIASIKNTQYA
jgi:tryptophan synthase alpha chain